MLRLLDGIPDDELHLSVLTFGEIRKGMQLLAASRRREQLRIWLERDLVEWFGERLLSVTVGIADRWGMLLGEVKRSVPAIDSLIAATALHHHLALLTRNENDFNFPGLEVINPWNTR